MSLAGTEILLAFKAGRAFRREGTNNVEPSRLKGAIYVTLNADDGLLHFIWKNRATNSVEEDLILFPFDASFVKVTQASSGRVYVLKFSSSNQRHFFWLQDASSDRDAEFIENLNGLLQDPDYDLRWTIPITLTSRQQAASVAGDRAQSAQSSSAAIRQVLASFRPPPELLRQIMDATSDLPAVEPISEPVLTEILTPTNLLPLFTNRADLVPVIFPSLPSGTSAPSSAEALQGISQSPQARTDAIHFDQALRSGLFSNYVRTLGLPAEADQGLGQFLRVIREQAENADGQTQDSNMMDTD